jgi:molybdopterin molybdotransferase
MLSVEEAQALVLHNVRVPPPVSLRLEPSCIGMTLAEDVVSDLDMPPFDKSLMDGFAVRAADFQNGNATLSVIGELTAGDTPKVSVGPQQALRIMTGAPIPKGADTVVMIERTKPLADNKVAFQEPSVSLGQNILPKAREMRCGEVVLQQGTRLRPQEMGILATVGRTQAQIFPRPTVGILSTGDELVEAPALPGPGQIRNGNGPMLAAQAHQAGAVPRYLGIARDRLDSLQELIAAGLESDVLVLSGGVSAGKLDLVPGVLQELGVQPHFHKVAMKPGKPVFFGTRGTTLVFGLPGNPVSALVCFELFVRPAIRKLMGQAKTLPTVIQARLDVDFAHRSDRPTYHPSLVQETPEGRSVRPVAWFGSADLRGLSQANALGLFPPGEHKFRAGDHLRVMPMDS